MENVNTEKYFVIRNGIMIPPIGFGTYQIPNGNMTYNTVTSALNFGYRHIDTAHAYGNEESVGKAVRDSGIHRAEIFVTSKLPAEIKTHKETLRSFERTMDWTGLEYVDLYLIHSPKPWLSNRDDYTKENKEVWKAMEEIYKSGRCRSIGVSNFNIADLESVMDNCRIIPMVNQIRLSVGHFQEEITAFCKKNDILVEAYSPLATGALLDSEVIGNLASKYSVTTPQICIRYLLQKGVLPIPKSVHPDFIKENIEVDFQISDEDMKFLDSLKDILTETQNSGKLYYLINGIKRTAMFLIGPEHYISLKNKIRSFRN